MRHHPGRLLGRQRRPGALNDPRTQVQGTHRTTTAVSLPIQAPLDPHRSPRTGRGRCTPQDAMVTLPFDLERRHIESEAGQFVAQRFTLRRDKEPMELLCKGIQIFDGLVRGSTLTQKVLELVHGMGITGQEVMTLQCLPRGSPLAYVVRVRTPLFQSGDAPSIGPHRSDESTEQTASTFIHQYVIYTHASSQSSVVLADLSLLSLVLLFRALKQKI